MPQKRNAVVLVIISANLRVLAKWADGTSYCRWALVRVWHDGGRSRKKAKWDRVPLSWDVERKRNAQIIRWTYFDHWDFKDNSLYTHTFKINKSKLFHSSLFKIELWHMHIYIIKKFFEKNSLIFRTFLFKISGKIYKREFVGNFLKYFF